MRSLLVFGVLATLAISANAFFNTYEVEERIKQHFAVEPPVDPENDDIEEKWVTQRLDHFNVQNPETWEQRYYENDVFYEEGGPIYIFVTGFNPVRTLWLTEGLMFDLANETNGLMLDIEHRFYGQSRPTDDVSVDNLRFLNHGQALGDLASFISQVKEDPDLEDAPVVLVGQLYGGSIAAWFRKRYPHLVAGVWASSPRIEARADVHEYLTHTAQDIFILGGQYCYNRIISAFNQIEEMINEDDADDLTEMFNLCQDIDTDDPWDVAAFAHTVAVTFGLYVDYGGEQGVENMCEMILDPNTGNDVEAVANFILYVYDFDFTDTDCLRFNYEYMSNGLRQDEWDIPATLSGAHQWTYQLCTEFGWFRTSTEEYQPFGHLFEVDIFYEMCADVFGDFITRELLDENIERVNINNGGQNPRITNAIFTIGSLDPWRSVAITDDVEGSEVFVIGGETTSSDLRSISDDDPLELFIAKRAIRRTILDWIDPDRDAVEERWATQRLDNFNLQDATTWEQRYLANGEHFEYGGPIYIFVGAQWPVDRFWLEQGMVYDIASETNGYLVAVEHRYYGESQPVEDLSPANLRWLSHDQALADLANFIAQVRRDREFRNSEIYLVSAGFGASLATWFAKRYPHLVDGVWASSAHLEARFDFSNYFEDVAEDISNVGGEDCLERIVSAFDELEAIILGSHPDVEDIDEVFNLCDELDSEDDIAVAAFMHGLELLFSIYIEVGGRVAVMDICDIVEDEDIERDVLVLGAFASFMYPDVECLDLNYGALIDKYDDFEWDSHGAVSGGRQWLYQRCTEFAWFRSSPQSFANIVELDHFVAGCDALFGDFFDIENINNAVDRINLLNGGTTPQVSNVIFTNGDLDPWRSTAVMDDLDDNFVFVIPGESQASDLYSVSPYDSVELREIKEEIRDIMIEWARPGLVPLKNKA